MSKKGQDNQRGISFQNKVAFLYMLDHYKYANFKEIRFEGDEFDDFTLFFNSNDHDFFHDFEVKNWKSPLSLAQVKDIIRKKIKKNTNCYSNKDKFYIISPSFKKDCKKIESLKESFFLFLNSEEDFKKTKEMYKKVYGDNPLLNWRQKEILFLKYLNLVELKNEDIDNTIIDRFSYEDPFFYNEDNLENIINRFLKKYLIEAPMEKT